MLTKASYIMLIVVPVLVALWPGVRYSINYYNKAVMNTCLILDQSSEQLQLAAAKLELSIKKDSDNDYKLKIVDQIENTLSKLDNKITESSSIIRNAENISSTFPCILSLSFFAAIFVVFAQAVYGMFIPGIIRKYTLTEYTLAKREEFAKQPSAGMLRTASVYCASASKNKKIKLAYGEFTVMKNTDDDHFEKNLDFISIGATARYLLADYQNTPARVITALLYSVGLTLLIAIIIKQSMDVIKVSGWML